MLQDLLVHGLFGFELLEDLLFLLILLCELVEVPPLLRVDGFDSGVFHATQVRRCFLRHPDRMCQTIQLDCVAWRWTGALTMRVGIVDPVGNEGLALLACELVLEHLSNLISAVCHYFLELFRPHQHCSPLHFILIELCGECSIIFLLFRETTSDLLICQLDKLLVDLVAVGAFILVKRFFE